MIQEGGNALHSEQHNGTFARNSSWTNDGQQQPAILVLSHLGWNYVWQRPQQILSRLARTYPILYVGEPEIHPATDPPEHARLDPVATLDHLRAWQPLFPDREPLIQNWRAVYTELVTLLLLCEGWVTRQDGALLPLRPLILWFYTPLPYYVLDHLPADLVVYDVMDELASFKGAASDLTQREQKLMQQADVVFTGGRSMYEAREGLHPNLHLFPSGVEQEHFAQATDPSTSVAPEIEALNGPILGYFGAIDERIDLKLLDLLAQQHPEWSIVMIGPVVKIKKSELPRQPNIHYLGKQPYESLPHFLKGFDVCLMPFALNEATRSISPTKTLEYMAAHKPIVSSAIPDVVNGWSDVVHIAEDREQFITLVEQALAEDAETRALRQEREQQHLDDNSWDHIVAEMDRQIQRALSRVTVR
jgi:glycosyltransferase involved in cell wall biosynthesis